MVLHDARTSTKQVGQSAMVSGACQATEELEVPLEVMLDVTRENGRSFGMPVPLVT
jgi:hypothetical protein